MNPESSTLGRTLVIVGLLLLVTGGLVIGLARLNLPLGRLPGDVTLRGRGWEISFPIVTCMLVSAVLSLLLWVFGRIRR